MNPLAVYLIFSVVVALLGRHRALGFWGFLFLSLLMTPLISLLVLAMLTYPLQPQRRLPPR